VRTLVALVFGIVVVALSWSCLIAFNHSLALSRFDVTGQPPKASFQVLRCDSTSRFKFGRTGEKDNPKTGELAGVAHVSVPSGCWQTKPDPSSPPTFVGGTYQAPSSTGTKVSLALLTLLGAAALGLLYPAVRGVLASRQAGSALRAGDVVEARILGDRARQWSSYVFGIGAAVTIVMLLLGFMSLANGGVRTPFFRFSLMTGKFGLIMRKFGINVKIFMITEVFVLVWGLVVAIARLAPGKAGAPVRWLAIGYIDLFRGIPAVIVLTILNFGLKKSGIPGLSKLDDFWYAVIALTLTYGAYVAEVYRSGIESIHWSQTAAARSLGLSYGQTMQHVIVPQAVRRIIPPLLNDFIGLQKDTALVGFIGVVDAFNQARTLNSNYFNLSAVTLVAAVFYVITVPQARFVDILIRRDQTKMRAGG
jgi:polar amino acid transport system permease protein